MSEVLEFEIAFHSPFRVGASYGKDGVDLAVDRQEPLNADHLKGVMKAAARDVLHLHEEEIFAVFGGPGIPSPWAWTAATARWKSPGARHRVQIEADTHTAKPGHLVLAEHITADRASFSVSRWRYVDPSIVDTHVLVLRCAGAAVHGIGGWRRRGLGWVGVTPAHPVTADDVRQLRTLKTVA